MILIFKNQQPTPQPPKGGGQGSKMMNICNFIDYESGKY